jgi:hypothetical protein
MLQWLLTLFVELVAVGARAAILYVTMVIMDTIYMEWAAPSMGIWRIVLFGAAWVILCLLWGFGRLRRCWVPALSAIPLLAAGCSQYAPEVQLALMLIMICQLWLLLSDLGHPDSVFSKAAAAHTAGNESSSFLKRICPGRGCTWQQG